MKRIKSNHLWRRGATLLLAMLMLFTCVGSALPAFAEEAAGNTATVDSGDPVLADSSASGDSTGDTGTDLPDDPQRPTLPSGEDISEEAPPADESDGETVPPADSDSSEDPAAPDSGDSIPDESESEPAEQPGEGDADLPEDEQPSGEEPDPDEDEEIPENEPEDEPFEALVILDPENGAAVQAGVGEEVTFKAPVSREDVAVAYQWQRFQKPAAGSVQTEALYDYAEGETTEYWYALDDMREAEALAMNPDMLWPGIEMYYATVAALDEIGADSSDVSIAWKTPNFALEGYTISAAETESGIEVYADKDDERHVAHLNENSEWEFGEAEEKPETTGAWLNIEGANGPEYAFTVEERDYDASFRCEVTVLDEVYLEQCLSILEEQGIELTEEQRAAEQKLYSVVMSVENGKEEALPEDEPMTFSMARSMLRAAASGKPQLSADAQWIEGLDGNYQYITKDTYDRVSEWLAKGEITETQAARYWTYLRPNGYTGSTVANVLDENGKPTGTTRQYQGFDLTDGMLEVNSEWYGKTVYFRVAGSGGTGTAITIPAYTELETDENGNYIEGASGTKYKKAITFLNPYVPDAKSMYQAFLNVTAADGWLLEQDASGNPTGATKDMHIQTYIVDCDSFNADPQRYMVDAEGNYRMDSVGWGVCVSEEPDLSGKAYWVLKDYLANGYGFLAGHDTMYAYPGAYYDAFGADLDESTIDPNDGTTWYYDINSWLPGTVGYTRDGRQSNTRGGHFYMNQLMGSNKGNVYSNTTTPSDSVSMLLSTGGSHGKYEKNIMFGGEELQVEQFGYFIEKESYSGAICREVLEVRIKNQVKLYGEADIETPWHINSFDANSTSNPKGWLSITGLKGTDKIELKDSFFKLGAFAPDNSTIAFGKQTPVGRYPVTETGITEANLPVLKNYIVSVYDGQLEIEPREVVVTASDGDWYVEDEGVPEVHATFEVQNDDRETYRLVGADNEASYANMLLMNSDTVEKFIRVTDGTAPAASSSTGQLRKILTSEAREYEEDGVKSTMLRNGSNIWYDTAWYVHAPARYLDLEAEYTLYPCEWCEQYHGFAMGTDHWHITGYETKVNQDAEKGDVLTVATVENPLGETVQNYKLRFVSGTLRVHPKLRFQLKATVPMYVCMYAYNGDGEVVEPTEYGITNYSNGAIRVTDINVDPTGGFLITDKAPLDLLRGEMSMNMFGTQLVPGANTPANPERWIAAADESEGVDGVFLHLPLECYIAGGNVNDETVCTPVTKVQYTIAEYGKTVPEVDDAELPEYIHGEPVTPSTTG